MIVTVLSGSAKELLPVTSGAHFVSFQNHDATNAVTLKACGLIDDTDPDANSYFLPKASSTSAPSEFSLQASGGDSTLVNAQWKAFGVSGSDVDIRVNRL